MTARRRSLVRRDAGVALVAFGLSCALIGPVWGQTAPTTAAGEYPAHPVRLIVPFSAGGASDVMARLIGQRLGERWNQPVVVENRVGAGGNIGLEAVARAPADGYTLVLMNNAAATNAAMNPRLAFDVTRDFAPIALVASTPMMLIAGSTIPATDLASLTEYLRTNPDRQAYGSCGLGGPQHFAAELYKSQTGVRVTHAPYRGCSQALADVLAGQIGLAMVSANVAIPQVRAGRIRAVALTARNRSPAALEVPTFRESGIASLRDYAVDVWYGVMAPAATSPEVLARVGADVRQILDQPEMRQKMAAAGIDGLTGDGRELMALLRADIETFRRVVRFADIRLE